MTRDGVQLYHTMTSKVLSLLLVTIVLTRTESAHPGRRATHRQVSAKTAAELQRQIQQWQIALQLPQGTLIHQGSKPPPAEPGTIWVQVPSQGFYPNQPGSSQQVQQPQQPQQPGEVPQDPASFPDPPYYPSPIPPYPGNQPIQPLPDNNVGPGYDPVTSGEASLPAPGGTAPGPIQGGGLEEIWGGGSGSEFPEGGTEVGSELLKFCLTARGQFPSQTSCSKFVNCWDDMAVEQSCPGGLMFNELGFCDYPENVDCGNRGVEKVEEMGEQSSCPTGYGSYRSSESCGIFYICNAGIPVKFECPEGLNYNTDLGVCDYPYRVDCGDTPSERPAPVQPLPDVTEGQEESFVPLGPTTDQEKKKYSGLRKVSASMVDSRVPCRSNAVFRLNPSCSSVSVCRQGYSTVINCAVGKAWDSRARGCINVYQAKC